jgi:hypothetical protein
VLELPWGERFTCVGGPRRKVVIEADGMPWVDLLVVVAPVPFGASSMSASCFSDAKDRAVRYFDQLGPTGGATIFCTDHRRINIAEMNAVDYQTNGQKGPGALAVRCRRRHARQAH